MQPGQRIAALQAQLLIEGIAVWIVPSTDPHQSEYTALHWQSRAWLSGFDGSAGKLAVTPTTAGLWTDARYHLRAEQELAGSGIELFRQGLPGVPDLMTWLEQTLEEGAVIGFAGDSLSLSAVEQLVQRLSDKRVKLYTTRDLVDELWHARPPRPVRPVDLYPAALAGETRAEKLVRVRAQLAQLKADSHLLTSLDDIAWTFNLRGSDVPYNPVFIAYALICSADARLFIDDGKLTPEAQAALAADGVVCAPYGAVGAHLAALPPSTTLLVDPAATGYHLASRIERTCRFQRGCSIPRQLKAVKNASELDGFRRAHLRDGVALVRWLIWLEEAVGRGLQTEVTAAARLTELRRAAAEFRELSFNTIVGYGANSAIGHYCPRPESTPTLRAEGILLVDAGAHYVDGTTDVTRTLSLGAPTAEQRYVFTTVLQSHIRLARAHFPAGTRGNQLDALARAPIWREVWECRHGIGHGVGHVLNVHEKPARFSKQNQTVIVPGMVLSNEPGVYFAGRFGVRLENIFVTVPVAQGEFGEFYGFETISYCPFDRTLIEPALLEDDEIGWLNDYHQHVYDALAPDLAAHERTWLAQATAPVATKDAVDTDALRALQKR